MWPFNPLLGIDSSCGNLGKVAVIIRCPMLGAGGRGNLAEKRM